MNRSIWIKTVLIASCCVFCGSTALAQLMDRSQAVKEFEALQNRMVALEKSLLAVSPEDLSSFADFLKQPNAGLIRLLPREKYDQRLAIRGGGSYYSFVHLTHEYGRGSDIELSDGNLRVGFIGLNFGFLGFLGDVPLESVDQNHPGVKFLTEFVPPSVESEIRDVGRKTYDGIRIGGYNYKRYVTAVPEKTYVLRSIDYHNGYDILIAFHILRRDADGSLVLRWKKIQDLQPPHMERQ